MTPKDKGRRAGTRVHTRTRTCTRTLTHGPGLRGRPDHTEPVSVSPGTLPPCRLLPCCPEPSVQEEPALGPWLQHFLGPSLSRAASPSLWKPPQLGTQSTRRPELPYLSPNQRLALRPDSFPESPILSSPALNTSLGRGRLMARGLPLWLLDPGGEQESRPTC